MKIVVTCLFGLESSVRDDLTDCGFDKEALCVSDGLVSIKTSQKSFASDIARANMWVRRGERVLLEIAEFDAKEFDSFYEETSKISWNDYIPTGYAITVNGYSRKSALFGISACQSLAKKAIVRSICRSRGLPEDALIAEDRKKGEVRIQFGIVKDHVSMMIDTTGDGLHKRGYRPLTHEAPIRETLASGMVSLARYKPFGYEALVDPFCGSGTILIEAAMMACNIAPGRNRHFAYETLPYIGTAALTEAREEAIALEDTTPSDDCFFFGSDIDKRAVEDARHNANTAGVGSFIKFSVADAATRTPSALASLTGLDRQLILTNPPYGGRLLTIEEADEIYKMIAHTYLTNEGFCRKGVRLSVITPDDTFERTTGFKADKRTKLYNGNIKCQLNNYYRLGKK